MIICENNTVFAKSDFWSKTRQPAPVSPTLLKYIEDAVQTLQMVNQLRRSDVLGNPKLGEDINGLCAQQ